MGFAEKIRHIRQHCFLSQEAFARELNVSFSSVNHWEGGRAKPNLAAMKQIKEFCDKQSIDFSALEQEWHGFRKED